jgi:hypothetical protein
MYCLFIQNFEEKQNVFLNIILKNITNKKTFAQAKEFYRE